MCVYIYIERETDRQTDRDRELFCMCFPHTY